MLRTIRGILSQCSRTQYRDMVKLAIKNSDVVEKTLVMSKIKLSEIDDFEKITKIEVGKFFAFQLGQTIALLEENIDLFTKKEVAEKYPDLKPFLYRDAKSDWKILDNYLDWFSNLCFLKFQYKDNLSVFQNNHSNYKESYDTKKESLVSKEKIKPIIKNHIK